MIMICLRWMFVFCTFLGSSSFLLAYENYGEVQDPGVWDSINGMYAFQTHYTNWMFYTMNVNTPGFLEQGVYNTRRTSDKLDSVPFFRFRPGPIVETRRKLDFYINAQGRGFFVIKLPTTLAYTRDGRFQLDSTGRLVTMAGSYPVLGTEGDIYLPDGLSIDDVTCSRSGILYAQGQRVGQLRIAVFTSFQAMQSMDTLNGSVFILTEELDLLEGPEHYAILQGHLEENNVLKAITGDILMAKNSYDANAKVAHLLNRAINTGASLAQP